MIANIIHHLQGVIKIILVTMAVDVFCTRRSTILER